MGERRTRKTFWDTENETKHISGMREHNSWAGKVHHSSHGSGRYHDLSDSRITSRRDSRNHSGWPSWESIEEEPVASINRSFNDTYEGKEMDGGRRYHKTISPGFEEMELHNYNHAHEYDRSHSQRYMRKGRSRSRSRSRTRGRNRSRSLSRERERGRGWSSRSRSRSDGYGYANAPRRSCSPIGDYTRQSYGWSDKRNGQELSSQTCRDFVLGRCRNGSQCQFFHPNSISRRDNNLVEDDRVESWRTRSDHSQNSKHSSSRLGFESRNDVSEQYHGEDEHFLSRSRTSIPCRDFKLGNCRWGDACRFSHDAASADSQDTRSTTFDKDFDRQQLRNDKAFCKFFAAGRCNRDNCRFSHDDPDLNNQKGRLDKITETESSHGKSNWPKWDDPKRVSDTLVPLESQTSHDKSNWPKWDDPKRVSDTSVPLESQTSHDKSNWPKWDDPKRVSDTSVPHESQTSHDKSNWPKWDDPKRVFDTSVPLESQTSHDKSNWTKWDDTKRISDTSKWDDKKGISDTSVPTESQSPHDKSNWPKWDDQARISDTSVPIESLSSHDKSNRPKWDDTKISDTSAPIGWNEAFATHTTSTGDITYKQGDDRWVFASKNENEIRGLQEIASNSFNSERRPSVPVESAIYGGDTGPAKTFADENMPHKQDHIILHGLQLQNKDDNANLRRLSVLQENQNLAFEALQQNVPPAPHIQQQYSGEIESNLMSPFGSNAFGEVKDTRYTNHPILLSGQYFNQNDTSMLPGHSSVPNKSDLGQNVLYPNLSNGHGSNLNQPETHKISSLNVQIHGQSDQKSVQSPVSSETQVPKILINLLPIRHPDQVSNSPVTNAAQLVSQVTIPVSLTQSFVNERSQTCAGIDISTSPGVLPSLSCVTDRPPLVNTSNVQDNVHTVPLDQFSSMGNSRENTDPGNLNLAQATDQSNQMQLNRSPPLSIVRTGVESSQLEHPESPRQQVEKDATLGVTGDSKAIGEESKGVQEHRPSENLDDQAKNEEGSAIKDEKAMRLFKNSLVELVKEILKPTWKEGRMSRDVHKTVVKKVVDKVSCTIQAEHIPKTQDKIEQYLSSSKPKITKLVQAYVERCRKTDA